MSDNQNEENNRLSLPDQEIEQNSATNEKKKVGAETDLLSEYEKVKERLKEIESQYLRLLADYQNLQKRVQNEKEELLKYAAQGTIEVMLPALDTFDYARQTVKPDSKPEKIFEDFSLVFEMMLKCLKDIGLETIEETGTPFNPLYHEPLHQIPTNELPDHTVMQVLKRGYILNKKVIRPALVSVSIKQEENK